MVQVIFRGSYIDINLNWTTHLTFHDGETFAWRKVTHPGVLDQHFPKARAEV